MRRRFHYNHFSERYYLTVKYLQIEQRLKEIEFSF